MGDTPKQALVQTSNSPTSTLRPRATRLISYLDTDNAGAAEGNGNQDIGTHPSTSSTPLPGLGKTASAAPNLRAGSIKQTNTRPGSVAPSNTPATGLWDSWSSIQGLASSLLGSDVQTRGDNPSKVPLWQKPKSGYKTSQSTIKWGQSVRDLPQLAAGTLEERQALVQAKKREALLLANGHERPDRAGRYKRRDSDADFSNLETAVEHEQDALVFAHKIQPQDTLAGVMIKYSCQPEVFRKVNRLWPNDNIQIRSHVFLPVDACAVRGKKLEASGSDLDLLGSELEDVKLGKKPDLSELGSQTFHSEALSSPVSQALSLTTSSDMSDYKHESWVQIPHFPSPTEILRIPRRTLGYFPPARRKSGAALAEYISVASTPKTSFDMLRHPPTHAASLNASPVRRPHVPTTRQRSVSTTTNSLNFVDHLRGPGGVGTLSGLRTEASRPGPAEDPLNRKFAQYFPDVAPPEDFPRTSLHPTARATPRASTDSVRSTSSTGIGERGGTIEGWMRKLAGPKGPRGVPSHRMGDLIELDTHSDMGDDDGEHTPTEMRTAAGTTATEEALLNERFPVRGRIRNAYVGKDKGD